MVKVKLTNNDYGLIDLDEIIQVMPYYKRLDFGDCTPYVQLLSRDGLYITVQGTIDNFYEIHSKK